jgi:hypothetical protein
LNFIEKGIQTRKLLSGTPCLTTRPKEMGGKYNGKEERRRGKIYFPDPPLLPLRRLIRIYPSDQNRKVTRHTTAPSYNESGKG